MVRITETLYDIERGTPLELHKPRAIFGNAQNLSYIEVSESNPNFYAKDGVLYSGDTLLRFPTVKPWDNKYLDGVRVIGTGAVFNHHERVRPDLPIDPPTVPATVEEIGDHAFSSCTFWTIEISEGVKRIGVSAFAGCACLDDTPIPMVVPKSVEQIGENAFKAARFPAIILLSKLETIPRGAFLAFTGEMIEFKHSVNGIGERAFAECINLKDVRIPSISGQIGAYAFSGCKQLEAMTIPATVTDICDSAFSYCDSLSRLEISDGVKRIENGAFDSCKSIRYVTLPGSLEYLSPLSFNDCQSLYAIFYEGSVSDYEELSDASKFEDVFLGSPEHIVHKIILKNERFRRLRRRAMLKIGDFLRKYQ